VFVKDLQLQCQYPDSCLKNTSPGLLAEVSV